MTAPAADDDTRFELLQAYLDDLHAGRAPARDSILARHPDLGGVLTCLEALEQLLPAAAEQATIPFPAVATATDSALPLRIFGKYEIESELGRGGMGVVYRARQTDLGRVVALKMIQPGYLSSPEHLRRFQAEARAPARISHPHIVPVFEAGQVEGQPYFAMQYVAGRSFAAVLAAGPLESRAAARIVCQIAEAVQHLHEHGIVHRDLKPGNILLGANDHPYVTDFGLVKLLGGDSQGTSTGVIVGTPSYMAPEQAAGRPNAIGPASDVYSLGAILYEALTGRPPFKADSPLDTLVLVLEGEPTPPRRLNPALPTELELICLRCLEKEPAERFASAHALAETLDSFLRGEETDLRPPGLTARLRRWARREPALAARLAMLLACVVIAQFAFYLLGQATLALHLEIEAYLALWAAGSCLCQRLLTEPRRANLARYLWASLDVTCFSLIAWRAEYSQTPIMIGLPLLVAGSGLWFDTPLVWFTASLCATSYVLLQLAYAVDQGELRAAHTHLVFLLGLGLLALITAYQVQRVRALSRYYEHRPLP